MSDDERETAAWLEIDNCPSVWTWTMMGPTWDAGRWRCSVETYDSGHMLAYGPTRADAIFAVLKLAEGRGLYTPPVA